MRKVFTSLVALLMLAVIVQFFLAASGAFGTAPNDEAFGPHRALGYAILLLAIVVTLVGALARMPGRLIGMTGLVVGLNVLQPVIAGVASAVGESGGSTTTAGELVFGLHAVNGLIIMALLGTIVRRSRELSSPARNTTGAHTLASGSASGMAEPAS